MPTRGPSIGWEIRSIGIALAAYRPNIDYLSAQLRSLQEQTFRDWVCVLTFDSPLEEVLAAPALASFREDGRFVWSENPERLGHRRNFERAMAECLRHGVDAVACCDQDDVWYPAKLETCRRALLKAGRKSLVHCDADLRFDDGREPSLGRESAWTFEDRGVRNARVEHLVVRNVVTGAASLMDADLIRLHPRVPEGFPVHDWWYAVVASSHGRVVPVHERLYLYRQHGTNVIGANTPVAQFSITPQMKTQGSVRTAINSWLETRDRARSVLQARLKTGPLFRLMYLGKDLGACLFVLGLAKIFSDGRLSRACWARAVGKVFFWRHPL